MKQWLYVWVPATSKFVGNFEDSILDFKICSFCEVKERIFEYLDFIDMQFQCE